ncbi:hypothetical protein D039_0479B, partial [Vibrio parahaemolyticus EKP-028]
KKSSASY